MNSFEKKKWKRLDYFNRKKFGGNKYNVFCRDNFCCVICGKTEKQEDEEIGRDLSIHHKNKNKKDNSIKNLMTICLKCHKCIHHPYEKRNEAIIKLRSLDKRVLEIAKIFGISHQRVSKICAKKLSTV